MWGFDKRSTRTYVPGKRFENTIPSNAVHAQTAEFSVMFSLLLGEAHGKFLSVVFSFVSAQGGKRVSGRKKGAAERVG